MHSRGEDGGRKVKNDCSLLKSAIIKVCVSCSENSKEKTTDLLSLR